MAGALDLLDEQVQALGGAVGGTGEVVVEDLGAPALEGPSELSDFLNRVQAAALDRTVQQQAGIIMGVGEVDLAHRFLGRPRPHDLIVGVAGADPQQHPVQADAVQTLGALSISFRIR